MINDLISECCQALPLGQVHDVDGVKLGFCRHCRDHATFTREWDEPSPTIAVTVFVVIYHILTTPWRVIKSIANAIRPRPF